MYDFLMDCLDLHLLPVANSYSLEVWSFLAQSWLDTDEHDGFGLVQQ